MQIILLLVCYSFVMPFSFLWDACVAPLFSDGVTPVRTDAMERIVVLCASSLLFSSCTECVSCATCNLIIAFFQ